MKVWGKGCRERIEGGDCGECDVGRELRGHNCGERDAGKRRMWGMGRGLWGMGRGIGWHGEFDMWMDL